MGNMLHELLQACLTAPPPPTSQTFHPKLRTATRCLPQKSRPCLPGRSDGRVLATSVEPLWTTRSKNKCAPTLRACMPSSSVPKRPLLNSARKQLPSLALRMSFYNTMTKLLSTPRPIFANKAVALGRCRQRCAFAASSMWKRRSGARPLGSRVRSTSRSSATSPTAPTRSRRVRLARIATVPLREACRSKIRKRRQHPR